MQEMYETTVRANYERPGSATNKPQHWFWYDEKLAVGRRFEADWFTKPAHIQSIARRIKLMTCTNVR